MKPDAYRRNIAARAFDVARYLLFWGVPTNVGQVTSIRTLEKQIRRLKASEYAELRESGRRDRAGLRRASPIASGTRTPPPKPLAPTLARHADPDEHAARSRDDLRRWAEQNLPARGRHRARTAWTWCVPPTSRPISRRRCSTPVTDRPFRELYEMACGWSERAARRSDRRGAADRARGATRSWPDSAAACTRTIS